MRRRQAKEALALLEPEISASAQTPELSVWRKITQGTAEAFLLHFDRSRELLSQAEELARSTAPSLLGEIALRKGTLAFLQDDSESARAAYHQALTLSRSEHDLFLKAAALGSLGLIATREEHYDESIDWNSQALRLSQLLGAQTSVARILGNLGWSHFELGDFDGALELYEQGAALSKKSGLLNDQIYWMVGVATAHYAKHDYATARKDLEQVLAVARGLDEKSVLLGCLNEITTVSLATGDAPAAATYNAEALQTAQAGLDPAGVMASHLLQARVLAAQGGRAQAERLFAAILQDPKANSRTRWEAEARLAKVMDEEKKPAEAEAHYRNAIATIGASRSAVTQEEFRVSFLSTGVEFFDAYIDFLLAHGRTEEALQVADLSRSMDLNAALATGDQASSLKNVRVEPSRVAGKLGATLLFYWIGREHSYLWAINRKKIAFFPLPPGKEIEPLVRDYRQAILDGRDVLHSDAVQGAKLYSLLVKPAGNLIPRNSRVLLLPAESLYGLNFETLIVPGPVPRYWLEDVTLSTGSSIRSLNEKNPALPASHANRRNLLLIGNPEEVVPEFPRLQQAPAEMTKVAGHFAPQDREVLQDARATPDAYLGAHPERFQYLHLVTHGTASHTHPLDSAVILSQERDSYKLYARDILEHPLRAELVTISACNGAGTRIYAGEGLVGLSWAFLHAGARHVISALWEVSDAPSTPRLMDGLYQGLDRREEPADALRAAKISFIRESGDSVFAKPYYWAPFQLYSGY